MYREMLSLTDLSDDQPIMRCLDLSGLRYTLGAFDSVSGLIKASFALKSLSYYRNCEDKGKQDSNEGMTKLYLGNNKVGTFHLGNEAYISCWSLVPATFTHFEIKQAIQTSSSRDCFIVISTIGKVKRTIQRIINNVFLSFENCSGFPLVLAAYYGQINYYGALGVPLSDWYLQNGLKFGFPPITTVKSIFCKPENYKIESEMRFAIILDVTVKYESQAINDPEIFIKTGDHYISEIFYLPEKSALVKPIADPLGIATFAAVPGNILT